MIKKYGGKEAFAAVLAQKKLNSTDKEAIETRHKRNHVVNFNKFLTITPSSRSNILFLTSRQDLRMLFQLVDAQLYS